MTVPPALRKASVATSAGPDAPSVFCTIMARFCTPASRATWAMMMPASLSEAATRKENLPPLSSRNVVPHEEQMLGS